MAGDKPPWRIALLRAVNLGPHNKAPAAKLRELMVEEGLANGQTLLASGNLAFRDGRTPAELEDLLESALQSRLGLRTEVIVRTGEAWAGLVAANPFADFARADPSHLVLIALKATLPELVADVDPADPLCSEIEAGDRAADHRCDAERLEEVVARRRAGDGFHVVRRCEIAF